MEELSYITVKTQVRRLRFFCLFLECIPKSGIPKELLFQRVKSEALGYQQELKNYVSSSGDIVSHNLSSSSLNNYYNALKSLGLVVERNNFIIKSRIGELYVTSNDLGQKSFLLNAFESTFFLYIFLKFDSDYFLCVLDLLYDNANENLGVLLSSFHSNLMRRFLEKIEYLNQFEKQSLNEVIQRISNWKSSKRYSEDIVSPRINWMIDLGLIDGEIVKKGKYNLHLRAIHFRDKMYNGKYSTINSDVIYSTFFSDINHLFFHNSLIGWSQMSSSEQEEYLYKLLGQAKQKFSIEGIPRLSVEQTLLYISLTSLKENLLIEFSDILEYIGFERKIINLKVLYRKAERSGESYFSLKYA